MKFEKTQDQNFMKLHNMKIVLDIIRQRRPVSRAEIAKITGMSPTSITRIVSELRDENLIRETVFSSSGVGRKAVMLDIVPDSVYTVGIHIDSNKIKVCIVDFNCNTVANREVVFPCADSTVEQVLEKVYYVYHELLNVKKINAENVIAGGIGIVGIVDVQKGVLVFSPQLGWENVPVAQSAARILNFPVILDNDIKTAALGESILCGMYKEEISFLGVGSGVGSAIITEGKLFRGVSNGAGEIGHIVIDPKGIKCDCGKRGCLQTFIAEWALIERARAQDPAVKEIDDIHRAYKNNVQWAVDLLEMTAEYIAIAVCVIVCSYNPNIVVVGGDLLDKFEDLFDHVLNKFDKDIYEPLHTSLRILRSKSNGNATVIGSAILAQQTYIDLKLNRNGLTVMYRNS